MNQLPIESLVRILLETEDDDLPRLCRLNTVYSNICKDDRFWKERIKLKYWHFIHLEKYFSSWKDFYHALSRKAIYTVILRSRISRNRNIRIATTMNQVRDIISDFISWVFDIQGLEHIDDLLGLDDNILSHIDVRIHFIVDMIDSSDPDFLLLGKKEEGKIYIHPNLSRLPSLSIKEYVGLVRILDEGYSWAYNTPHTSWRIDFILEAFILYIFEQEKNRRMIDGSLEILPIGISTNKPLPNIFHSYELYETSSQYDSIFIRYELPPVVIREDARFAIIPKKFYEQIYKEEYGCININRDDFVRLFIKVEDELLWHRITDAVTIPPLEIEFEQDNNISYCIFDDEEINYLYED